VYVGSPLSMRDPTIQYYGIQQVAERGNQAGGVNVKPAVASFEGGLIDGKNVRRVPIPKSGMCGSDADLFR
jgi:hypothetical protein